MSAVYYLDSATVYHTAEGWIVGATRYDGARDVLEGPFRSALDAEAARVQLELDCAPPWHDEPECGGTHANPCSEMCLSCH